MRRDPSLMQRLHIYSRYFTAWRFRSKVTSLSVFSMIRISIVHRAATLVGYHLRCSDILTVDWMQIHILIFLVTGTSILKNASVSTFICGKLQKVSFPGPQPKEPLTYWWQSGQRSFMEWICLPVCIYISWYITITATVIHRQ